MSGTIPARGGDRPAMKLLNKHVRNEASPKWHDLGLELLEQEDEERLNQIEIDNSKDTSGCCKEMFRLWLRKCKDPTWDKLISALKEIDLINLATKIEKLLKPMEDVISASVGTSQSSQQVTTSGIDQKQPSLECNDSDDTKMDIFNINFSEYENVCDAFAKLFTVCQKAAKVSNEEFETIRNSCVSQASKPIRDLMKCANNTHCLFEVLADNNQYCNWMNVRFLRIIAIACGNEQLQSLIESYTSVIYSRKLREVWNQIPHYSVRDKYYSELKAVFGDRDPDSMTIEDLMKRKPTLAKEITMLIAVVQEGSVVVTWLIPTDEVYQAYLSFLTVPQQSRMDELVQFATWTAYSPKNVLEKYKKEIDCEAVSTPTLLIGYYHGLLLRDIDADLLADKMCSTGLLTANEQTVISCGHTLHQRNWLLLEYVRHMDLKILLEFCKLLKEEWPEIGSQLLMALESLPSEPQSTISALSDCQCDKRNTANGSIILVLYFHLIDQLEELLQSYDYEIMMNQCKSLMASDRYSMELFSSDQLMTFSECNSTTLLRMLCLCAWNNCSILRRLADFCKEAMKLLDHFESYTDPLNPITSYPIPYLSSDMMPDYSSMYTILAVRCKVELYECPLQYIHDVQSVMIDECKITQHCLQLLAVRNEPTIFYWTIPKSVVYHMKTTIALCNEYLYSSGILEVFVYPDLLLTTVDNICFKSLIFECVDTKRVEQKLKPLKLRDTLDEQLTLTPELIKKEEPIENMETNEIARHGAELGMYMYVAT